MIPLSATGAGNVVFNDRQSDNLIAKLTLRIVLNPRVCYGWTELVRAATMVID